jgi:hypothetical protein
MTLWAFAVALTSFFGLLAGPVYFYSNFERLQTPCCFTSCPVYMVAGAFLGFAIAIYLGGYIFGMGLQRVVYTFRILWCFEGA